MTDDIKLPPLPRNVPYQESVLVGYARAAVLADREAQERKANAIGVAFMRVLADPAVRWRQTESWDFITRVADDAGEYVDEVLSIDRAPAARNGDEP
jgi:hypothetical protein